MGPLLTTSFNNSNLLLIQSCNHPRTSCLSHALRNERNHAPSIICWQMNTASRAGMNFWMLHGTASALFFPSVRHVEASSSSAIALKWHLTLIRAQAHGLSHLALILDHGPENTLSMMRQVDTSPWRWCSMCKENEGSHSEAARNK